MEPWWERHPDAFEAEKDSLNASGWTWKIDTEAWRQGKLVIEVAIPQDELSITVKAEYPETFPYFGPHVIGTELIFSRHQNPFTRTLCLLARNGEDWDPSSDTLATVLLHQLPKVLTANKPEAEQNEISQAEDHVGEPFSSHLQYKPPNVLIVPDDLPPADHFNGQLKLLIQPQSGNIHSMDVRGVLRTIADADNHPLVEFDMSIPVFKDNISGYWMRLPKPPSATDQSTLCKDLFRLMQRAIPAFKQTILKSKPGQTLIAGFVYEDEISWRNHTGDWLLLAIRCIQGARKGKDAKHNLELIQVDWGGHQAWMQRAPALKPLRSKSAILVGLGSLGSTVSLQLAKAGVGQLSLVDFDKVQVGNTVRWALGWRFAGYPKTLAVASQIQSDYPYTNVDPINLVIGNPAHSLDNSDYHRLRKVCESSDLIIDASANYRVSHFLSDLAIELAKPYLWVTTTHGAAGGVIGRIDQSEEGGCWHCFQHRLGDRSIRLPEDASTEEVQPGGCSQPTFIGAGLDSDTIALQASRLAISTLCRGEVEGYADFDWDVAIVDLNRDGQNIAPDYATYKLLPHPQCHVCSAM